MGKSPLVIALVCSLLGAQAQTSHTFRPSAADSEIVDFDNLQYAYLDEEAIARRDKLVVFLPGTGGTPFFYREFLKHSATLGFHALGLMYPNQRSVGRLCGFEDPQNPDCLRDVRLEIIEGSDRTGLVEVDRRNSIEYRLAKAIAYLQANHPSEGWGQFLQEEDGEVSWDRILICGHSQGGGHAALIAKRRVVDRCLIFAAADWFSFGNRLADWAHEPSATPARDVFIFGHEDDALVPWDHVISLARACDLDRFGEYVSVDPIAVDLRNRHILSTTTEETTNVHNSVVVDQNTPRDETNIPIFQSVWRHMLLSETPALSFEYLETEVVRLYWQSGILEESTDLESWADRPAAESPLTLMLSEVNPRIFFRVRH